MQPWVKEPNKKNEAGVFAAPSLTSPIPSCCCPGCQVCHLHGQEDWRAGVRPPRGPGGGEAKDGDDSVCLPHGQGLEENLADSITHPVTSSIMA